MCILYLLQRCLVSVCMYLFTAACVNGIYGRVAGFPVCVVRFVSQVTSRSRGTTTTNTAFVCAFAPAAAIIYIISRTFSPNVKMLTLPLLCLCERRHLRRRRRMSTYLLLVQYFPMRVQPSRVWLFAAQCGCRISDASVTLLDMYG